MLMLTIGWQIGDFFGFVVRRANLTDIINVTQKVWRWPIKCCLGTIVGSFMIDWLMEDPLEMSFLFNGFKASNQVQPRPKGVRKNLNSWKVLLPLFWDYLLRWQYFGDLSVLCLVCWILWVQPNRKWCRGYPLWKRNGDSLGMHT